MRRQISAESSVRRRLNETLRREREMREAGDRDFTLEIGTGVERCGNLGAR